MPRIKLLILFYICVSNSNLVFSKCINSYIPICATVRDIRFAENKSSWEELLIQPSNDCRPSKPLKYTLIKEVFSGLGLNNLKRLTIVRQFQRSVSFAFIKDLSLEKLVFFENSFKIIKRKTFENVRLNELSLKKNDIKILKSYAFSRCSFNLLDLSRNQIKSLPTYVFSECTIYSLRINNNKLTEIQDYSLPSNLLFLILSYNRFRRFSLSDQTDLILKGLILSHNQLTSFELLTLQTLNYLDLSFNQLTQIGGELRNLTKLGYLNLKNNKIRNFDLDLILQAINHRSLLYLGLSNNKLRRLDLEKIKHLDVQLTLHGNPWNCQCLDGMNKILHDSNSSVRQLLCDVDVFKSGQVPVCLCTGSYKDACSNDSVPEAKLKIFEKSYSKYFFCRIPLFYLHMSDGTLQRAPFDFNFRELNITFNL